jgi:hypothetical protein
MARVATKKTEVFTFEELSPKGQDKAIENFSEREGQNWSGEDTIEEYKRKLEGLGFDDVEANYSGFYSQGDGASFTAASFDVRKAMKDAGIASKFKSFYCTIRTQDIQGRVYRMGGNYVHECTVKVDFPDYYGNNSQEADVADALTEYVRGLSKELYRLLESDYEYARSDENARQYLEGGDEEYTANGEEYN